jgi:uncharacterized repeat protein (TIGR03803 family)
MIPSPGIFCFIVMIAGTVFASTPTQTVLHTFRSGSNDGLGAFGRVISDAAGNLYGTTALGGSAGAGIVFELTKPQPNGAWTETVLYNFSGGNDGAQPYGGVIFDAAGNLYGTTYQGGASNAGTVYELMPPSGGGGWTETVLYSFADGADGRGPQSDLIFDASGNLYGTTDNGGSPGNGIVFQLTPGQNGAWTENILHRFVISEGTSPRAAVIFDALGSLYGTLANDGQFGAGAVFRLKPPATLGGAWTEETLYTFTGGSDGFGPLCRLLLHKGNLYGTTVRGGTHLAGTVFELAPPASHSGPWTETVLHSFGAGEDGYFPWAGLIMDKTGALYGTTQRGGLPSSGGTVFQMTQSGGVWTETMLYSFKSRDNHIPVANVLLGGKGILYGTTAGWSGNAGMVFKIHF